MRRPTAQPPPTHPFLSPQLPKSGRSPKSRALANETDPGGAPSPRLADSVASPRRGPRRRLCNPTADRDQAPFATSSRIAPITRSCPPRPRSGCTGRLSTRPANQPATPAPPHASGCLAPPAAGAL